jgi:EAL domain-containing protein (putative c-di-GMP-specific phosphodiesterase class I)
MSVELAIDDFGTGYSSLSYLKRFPMRFLKIDRSFIYKLENDPDDTMLVSGMITLAHSLGMQGVAEGVETAEHLARLREMGCDVAQGNYFSEPVSSRAMTSFLANGLSL